MNRMNKQINALAGSILASTILFSSLANAQEDSDAMADMLQALVHAETDTSEVRKPKARQHRTQDLSIWDSERFQKQFMGSYGVNSDIEPRVSAVEREDLQEVMDILSEEDDMDKAMEKLLKMTTPSSSALFDFTVANLYFQQEQQAEALRWYEQAIEKFPSFRRAYKNAGLIHMQQGEFKQALPFLTKTVELGGHTSLAYGLLGFAYASEENHLCAESAYRQAILLDAETLDWQLGLARSLFKQQKFGDAVSLCNALIKQDADNPDFWLLQANAYLGLKQPIKAAENYEYVRAKGLATPDSMTMLADIYVNESYWDLAADAYIEAYTLDGGNSPEKLLRAAKILAGRGALNEAKIILNRVAEQKQELEQAHLKEMLKLQARVAVAEGGGADVVKVLEEVVTVDPLDGEALILLGQHYGRDKPEKAIFYYERAANVEKYEAEAKLYHGQLLVGMARYQDAIPLLRRAYELKPRSDIEDYLKQVERIAKTRS